MFKLATGLLRDVDYMLLVVLVVQLYVLKTLMARASRTQSGTFGRKNGRASVDVFNNKNSLETHSAGTSIPSRYSANTPSRFSVPSYNNKNFNSPIPSQLGDTKRLTTETRQLSRSCPSGSSHHTAFSKIDPAWSLLSKCSTRPLVAAVIRKHADLKGRKRSEAHNELDATENISVKIRSIDITLDSSCSSATIVGDMLELETSIPDSDIGLVSYTRKDPAPANVPNAASKFSSNGMTEERTSVKDKSTTSISPSLGSLSLKVPEKPTANVRSSSGIQDSKVRTNQLVVNAGNIEFKDLWTVPTGFCRRGSDIGHLGAQYSSQLVTVDKQRDEEKRVGAPDWRALVLNEKAEARESDLTYADPRLERTKLPNYSELISVNARATSETTRTVHGDQKLLAPTCERQGTQTTATTDVDLVGSLLNVSHCEVSSGESKDTPASKRKQWNPDVLNWRERAAPFIHGSQESSFEDNAAKRVRSDAPNWRERAVDSEQFSTVQPVNARRSNAPNRRELSRRTSENPLTGSKPVPRVEQVLDLEMKAGGAMRTWSSAAPTLSLRAIRRQKSVTLGQAGCPISSSSVEANPLPVRPSGVHGEQTFNQESHVQMKYRSPALLKRLGFAAPTESAYRGDSPGIKQIPATVPHA